MSRNTLVHQVACNFAGGQAAALKLAYPD